MKITVYDRLSISLQVLKMTKNPLPFQLFPTLLLSNDSYQFPDDPFLLNLHELGNEGSMLGIRDGLTLLKSSTLDFCEPAEIHSNHSLPETHQALFVYPPPHQAIRVFPQLFT